MKKVITAKYANISCKARRRHSWLFNEEGFAFAATAIVVSLILGFAVLYLSNSVSLNITQASNVYSATQSYWGAVSGVEYAIQKAEDGPSGIAGTYNFYHTDVVLQFSSTDRSGNPLGSDRVRLISTGLHGETERIVEITFEMSKQHIWPDLSMIEEAEHGEEEGHGKGKKGEHEEEERGKFKIERNFTLNDSIYIGADVDADKKASIGDPPGDRTHIYVPTGSEVEGEFDANFSWSEHPDGVLNLPVFSFPQYDSLIAIAQAIGSTSGNKHKGDFTVDGGTFDLSAYEDNTFFVKGKFTVKGGTVTGGTIVSPGIIVATKDMEVKKKGGAESSVDDNIIFICKKKVHLKNRSQFGVDYSSMDYQLRPKTVNEIYAQGEIRIDEDCQVWAQVYSMERTELKGSVFGLIYTPDRLDFGEDSSFLEGALFVRKIKEPEDKLDKGRMDLNHAFPVHYFSGIEFQVVAYSFSEI